VARREYARGDYESAYRLLTEYLYRYPEADDAAEARRLLRSASERRGTPGAATITPAKPNTIGVVLPVTGPGAPYGRQFALGVETAVAHHNASSERQAVMVKADSKGSAVGAVKAVRRLLLDEGAVGVVGSVFTMPTFAACIEANAWGAAMLSPVVSSDELVELGAWVFQTKVPLAVEVTAVAEAAVGSLLIERFAVVAPSRGTRHDLARLFADEVSRLGAQVVAAEYYEEGATDFREQLEAVREAAPEAIFAPGSVDELLLLLPQIKFYDLQVQLLGLSNWNADKLLRLSRDELEGALFPLEAYRGTDTETYVRFREAMNEREMTEISPIAEAGYFGMRLMLRSLDDGASSREDVRAYLESVLRQGASGRMAEAGALSLRRVRGGRVVDFVQ
jgi:branched-chain amino acid transport system substrate-binding protein